MIFFLFGYLRACDDSVEKYACVSKSTKTFAVQQNHQVLTESFVVRSGSTNDVREKPNGNERLSDRTVYAYSKVFPEAYTCTSLY